MCCLVGWGVLWCVVVCGDGAQVASVQCSRFQAVTGKIYRL